MRRGEVWVARLNPHQGAELGKVRPVVVIQADALTEAGLATLLVVLDLARGGIAGLRQLVAVEWGLGEWGRWESGRGWVSWMGPWVQGLRVGGRGDWHTIRGACGANDH